MHLANVHLAIAQCISCFELLHKIFGWGVQHAVKWIQLYYLRFCKNEGQKDLRTIKEGRQLD